MLESIFYGYDEAAARLLARLEGLTDLEYFWEPVQPAWTIRRVDGRWLGDWTDPDPVPAPVTTIAWRLWHLASDCLADYVEGLPGGRPIAVRGREWHGAVEPALRDLSRALGGFRAAVFDLGEDGIHQPLGPTWGQFADASWLELTMHACDELSHHGAEIALLRDLYESGTDLPA
jgi:hypothetical protein